MSALVKHLSCYADYHRNSRNVATHMIGVPLIVLSIEALLSRPQWAVGPLPVTPAMIASAAGAIFYLRLDVALGAVTVILLALGSWAGLHVAAMATGLWLGAGIAGFVAGWIIQFVGHAFEGRKPAFLDDLIGLLIGPIFVMAEAAFALGFRRKLRTAIEASLAG